LIAKTATTMAMRLRTESTGVATRAEARQTPAHTGNSRTCDPLAGLEVRDVQANRTNQDAQNSDSLDDSGSNSS
jgi:hypothetical protein